MDDKCRKVILDRLKADLVGPYKGDEILESRPSDLYLTGILWPRQTSLSPEEDEKLAVDQSTGNNEEALSAEEEEVSKRGLFRPSSAGISFAVESAEPSPTIAVEVRFATYELVDVPVREVDEPENEEQEQEESPDDARKGKTAKRWKRNEFVVSGINIEIADVITRDLKNITLEQFGVAPDVDLNLRAVPWGEKYLVTVTLLNNRNVDKKSGRDFMEKATLFQTRIEVTPLGKTFLSARPSRRAVVDEDDRSNALLYRMAKEYAVGHTCSASWDESDEKGYAKAVYTEWIPSVGVSHFNPKGHELFRRELDASGDFDPLSAEWLSKAEDSELQRALEMVPFLYGKWIENQYESIDDIGEEFKEQALRNLDECGNVQRRMLEGAKAISGNRCKGLAFRLANRAISLQYSWNESMGEKGIFRWRPFQIGFLLLTADSVVEPSSSDRNIMDLLWFPTGGGKTEAYLGLIAYLIFYRRLSSNDLEKRDASPSVNVIMRYTLRTLTTQQFERAASMIFACEILRRSNSEQTGMSDLGQEPFSIGLWVGGDATPNRCSDVPENIMQALEKTPAQILKCPACQQKIFWERSSNGNCVEARCQNRDCPLFHETEPLPIWTVDEDVYHNKPSLVIGTVDKFAQITRNSNIRDFFSIGESPPDLIIQDELHLISGPLGTLAGLYETAIDRLFYSHQGKPKIIGSTATIRRASDQVGSLFNRKTCQFPPPAIDYDDSGFAVTDIESPGRIYAAVTTAGRSAKFALQAVSASLLQSAMSDFPKEEVDPYWTLVCYFNSIRELGGALVLMQDDVPKSIDLISGIRDEKMRELSPPEEMTSRKKQAEIRDLLQQLKIPSGEEDALDILLATNMLSVGVDIPRLGLMLVNGQPKGISEYIQATSRVGRGNLPGLVISVLNNVKPRDRSHYESFKTWHSSLYRDVEVTSVTPFASRARDKALHAILVALVRNLIPGMQEKPEYDLMKDEVLESLILYISKRACSIDPEETAVEEELREMIDEWRRKRPSKYWDPRTPSDSLLQDADRAAAARALGYKSEKWPWPTPNNMRSVEPSTKFFLEG